MPSQPVCGPEIAVSPDESASITVSTSSSDSSESLLITDSQFVEDNNDSSLMAVLGSLVDSFQTSIDDTSVEEDNDSPSESPIRRMTRGRLGSLSQIPSMHWQLQC